MAEGVRPRLTMITAMANAVLIVFLVLVYVLVVTPAALLLRLFGRRPLSSDRGRGRASYWRAVITDSDDVAEYRRYY